MDASGMEAGRAETLCGSVHDNPARRGCLKRYIVGVVALVVGSWAAAGREFAPDGRCFDHNGAVVAFIAEIMAGFLLDKQKLPLVEPMVYPAGDGVNLADRVRIAWGLVKLPPNSKPEKISRPLVGGEAFEGQGKLRDVTR